MTSRSSGKDQEDGEALDELRQEMAIVEADLGEAKDLIVVLKRELSVWQRRAERAELECARWKATANEWRQEFLKRRP
jgi:chromosome segregation ATPase